MIAHVFLNLLNELEKRDKCKYCQTLCRSISSKTEGKDQESMKSNTTPDPGHHMGK